jgi:hypothetical protein
MVARLFRWALAVLCAMLVVELVQSQLKLARTSLLRSWELMAIDFIDFMGI